MTTLDKILEAKRKRSQRVKKLLLVRKKLHKKPVLQSLTTKNAGTRLGSHSTLPMSSGESRMCAYSASEVRKNERRVRNRQAAMNSRMKNIEEVKILKEKIQQLEDENKFLKLKLEQQNGYSSSSELGLEEEFSGDDYMLSFTENNNYTYINHSFFVTNGHAVQL